MTRSPARLVTALVAALLVCLGVTASLPAAAQGKSQACSKLSGQVLMTYDNPDTIIMGTGKGMNIATVFTMTPTTTYTRNGATTNFDGIRYLDVGYISFRAVYPSGSLMACAVTMTGP